MEVQNFDWPDAEVSYYPSFFNSTQATKFFYSLLGSVEWKSDKIKVFGKEYDQPRLTALYADNDKPYSYSSITMYPKPFNKDLMYIKSKIEEAISHSFSSCLLNLYRDGRDSNGWHADNEKELGINPVIASVSFGAKRSFRVKHRTLKEERHKIILQPGSLLIMGGEMQHHWLHQIPKTSKRVGPRINLTYRLIK